MSTTATVQKWNPSIEWPRDNYILRCIEQSFGPSSSSGKPMITLKHEVVSPETISVAGVEYQIVGHQIITRHVTKSVDRDSVVDEVKSDKLKNFIDLLYKGFHGENYDTESIDVDNPKLDFVGKLVHAFLYDDPSEQRKTATPEQIKKGQPGDIIVNPITKQPRVSHYPKVGEFYGPAEANPNKPF